MKNFSKNLSFGVDFKLNIKKYIIVLLIFTALLDMIQKIQGPPSNVFFPLTSAYFVNDNTQLMSDLTDNQFYPCAERIWLCICLNNALLSGPAINLQKMPILATKKLIFAVSDEAHFNLGGYVNRQNCRIWDTENPHAYIEKSTHAKRVTVWCGF